MKKLEPEKIIVLDKIIEKLDETNLDGNAILEICGDDKMAETVCGILEDDGWIGTTRVDQQNYPIHVRKSGSFRTLLARIGNYAEQAKAEEQRFQPVVINATSSNIAVGNTSSSVIQTINNNEVVELIQRLIQETGRNNDIIHEEKEEIIELLADLNNSIKQGSEPPKSVLKRLAYYGEKGINIGASILTILSIIKG